MQCSKEKNRVHCVLLFMYIMKGRVSGSRVEKCVQRDSLLMKLKSPDDNNNKLS